MSTATGWAGLTVVPSFGPEALVDATPRAIAALGVASPSMHDFRVSGGSLECQTAGEYFGFGTVSFSGSASKTFFVAPMINGQAGAPRTKRKLGASGDVGAAAVTGSVTLRAGDLVTLCQWSSDGGTVFKLEEGGFFLFRLPPRNWRYGILGLLGLSTPMFPWGSR